MTTDSKGPWGTPQPDDGPDNGADGAPPNRPTSPWLPPSGDRADPPGGQRRGATLEEMIRRGRGPFGPQMPKLPGGRSLWMAGGAVVLLLWLAATSFWRIDPEQEGVVTRFGSYSRTVGPGISLTWPAPIERMQPVSVREIRTADIPGGTSENLVLTSDANIIDLSYSVRWTIKEPERYLFQLDNPDATLRAVAESAMRATVANYTLVQALTSARTDIERQVQQRTQAILDRYRSGIRIEGVAVRGADPPSQVEEAFNNVNAARQRAEGRRNQARAYAEQVLRRAEGEAGAFDRVYAEYRLAPEVTRRRMYYETMERILQRADKTVVESAGVTPYLPLPEVRRRGSSSANPALVQPEAPARPQGTNSGANR
jgi:membrane protease subunit HflK